MRKGTANASENVVASLAADGHRLRPASIPFQIPDFLIQFPQFIEQLRPVQFTFHHAPASF